MIINCQLPISPPAPRLRRAGNFQLFLKKNQKGFTLIEVLIYTVIFGAFLFLAAQVFLTINNISANSAAMANLQQNYIRIFSDLNTEIKKATNVVSPTTGNSGATLSLNNGTIIYQVINQDNINILKKTVNGVSVDLTNGGVTIPSINFENIGAATQAATVKVTLTLDSSYLLEGGRVIREDFQTTIGLKTEPTPTP